MREIVLDTETTGLDPFQGHRLIEIGCVELLNGIPTGKAFHRYLNPERTVPPEAFAVHGLSDDFLKDKPFFADVADELLAFIADVPLVAHNALFDLGLERSRGLRAGRLHDTDLGHTDEACCELSVMGFDKDGKSHGAYLLCSPILRGAVSAFNTVRMRRDGSRAGNGAVRGCS